MKKILALLMVVAIGACSSSAKIAQPVTEDINESALVGRMAAYTLAFDLYAKEKHLDSKKLQIKTEVASKSGFVEEETLNRLVFYVPSDVRNEFTTWLTDMGADNTSRQMKDHTSEYETTTTEITLLKTSQEKYKTLMQRSAKIEDALKVEAELTRVNRQLSVKETLKKKIESMVNNTKITVNFNK